MYNSSGILQYCKVEHFIKRHSTKEQSQWKYFRLEIEYVARLEQLATKLEQEAKIIRGFLAKNYGHFDSRWSCLAPWAIILIFLETCFSFLLILIPIADCNQSQQTRPSKQCKSLIWIMILGFLGPRGPLVLPSVGPVPSVPSARKIWITIYRHICLMNHEKTHQTNPMAPWDPLDALSTP